MKYKLLLLALFTAVVSVACAGNSQMARENPRTDLKGTTKEMSGTVSNKPITLHRIDLVAGGQCEAKLTFDTQGSSLISVETDTPGCAATQKPLLVDGHNLADLSGSITFGGSCTTCYNTIYGPRCITDTKRNC